MSYSTDILHFFADQKHWISGEALKEIGYKANQNINLLKRDWFESLLSAIAGHAERPIADIKHAVSNDAGLLETMYYCQIGRPEMILIYFGSEELEDSTSALFPKHES
jgi:hypothetical protein